jgi:hypothetical protein
VAQEDTDARPRDLLPQQKGRTVQFELTRQAVERRRRNAGLAPFE